MRTAKEQSQPAGPGQTVGWRMYSIQLVEYYSVIKKMAPTPCSNMDGTGKDALSESVIGREVSTGGFTYRRTTGIAGQRSEKDRP